MPARAKPKKRRSNAHARWGWSGFGIVPALREQAPRVRAIVSHMPQKVSSIDGLSDELLRLGGRYQRYLHQDEFGPARAERMAALRTVIAEIDGVIDAIADLPLVLQRKLRATIDVLSPQPLSYTARFFYDLAAVRRIAEAANQLQTRLKQENAETTPLENLLDKVGPAARRLEALDTTTESDIFMMGAGRAAKPFGKAEASHPLASARAGLLRLRQSALRSLEHLERRGGADPVTSLRWLVQDLCELWRREVKDSRVTVGCIGHSGRPVTKAGRFLLDLVEAFAASAVPLSAAARRAKIYDPDNRTILIGALDAAVREHVRGRPKETPWGPLTFAVLRLMASSNSMVCSIGSIRSALLPKYCVGLS